jgi:hypothetical protein
MRKLKTIDDNEKKQHQRKVLRSEDERRISKTGDERRVPMADDEHRVPMTENDRRISKSGLSDRLCHMLNNQLMCDVTFHVGSTQAPIKSHKFMLASASPVFYRMLDGPNDKLPNV